MSCGLPFGGSRRTDEASNFRMPREGGVLLFRLGKMATVIAYAVQLVKNAAGYKEQSRETRRTLTYNGRACWLASFICDLMGCGDSCV